METADGWLVRIRVPGGRLTVEALRIVMDVADRWGSGALEVTGRGNLQIRGVASADVRPVGAALVAGGLALPDPRHDALRSIVTNPLAGHDPAATVDPSPLLQELRDTLPGAVAAGPEDRVPAKFGIVIDDGGSWDLSSVDADIRIRPLAAGWLVHTRGGSTPLGWTTTPVPAIISLTSMCARHRARLDEVIEQRGRDQLRQAAGLADSPPVPPVPPTPVVTAPGRRPSGTPGFGSLVTAPFLGRMTVADLDRLCSLVEPWGIDVRTTPRRSLALCSVPDAATESLLTDLNNMDWVTGPDDPRALVSACVGAPGCAWAHASTDQAARAVARGRRRTRVHLSGCAKRCGAPAGVDHLVAQPNGLFR